jgi:ADP-ribosylglycohydrolase
LERPIKGWPGWEEFKAVGDPEQIGHRRGNGAPMRIAPVGIINSPKNLEKLIDDVEQACIMTHYVSSTISAACAIAAAISAAVEGWPKGEVLELALEAARRGGTHGQKDQAPQLEELIRLGLQKLKVQDDPDLGLGCGLRGLNPGFLAWEGASFALCLAYTASGAKEAILEAVNQGGDADSIAAMAGGIAAALQPESLPQGWITEVERVNKLDLRRIAEGLVSLRR